MIDAVGGRTPFHSIAGSGPAAAAVAARPLAAVDAVATLSALAAARADTAAGPPVDGAQVARIRAALATGNYPVDAHAIAAKMVETDCGALR